MLDKHHFESNAIVNTKDYKTSILANITKSTRRNYFKETIEDRNGILVAYM